MIRLWNSTESTFKGNRWVLSETTKCNVTEVINGEFAADLEYPLKDSKDLSKKFLRGNLITCPVMDDRPEQQFRIRKVDKTSSGVIVYAQAKLIADLGSNYIRAMTLTGLTRKQAIQAVLNAALEPHSFKVGALDLSYNTNVIVNIKEGTVLQALIGNENSILSEYGGEFIINNDTFDIVDSRGANRKFRIAYGKNIASIKETIDDIDLATVLIPKSGDYRLPEYIVESPKVGNYEKRYFQEVDMNLNIWDGTNEKGEDQITVEEAYSLMRTTCNNMFLKDKIDQVTFNYVIDLISLRKTEEYKNYNIVEKVYLGDTVIVDHKLLNVDLEGKVNKTVYNVLLDKYNSTEIGFTKQDITDIIKTAVKQIKFAKEEINLKIEDTSKHITAAFKIADNAIKQNVTDVDNRLSGELNVQANKINAVVEEDGTGEGWELSKNAFKVACIGASGAFVVIDASGLTVNDGKFVLKKGSNTVFYVNTSGRCTADGGFVVSDGSSSTLLDANGIHITNTDGETADLGVNDIGRFFTPGSVEIDKGLDVNGFTHANGTMYMYGSVHIWDDDGYGSLNVDRDVNVGDDVNVSDNVVVDGTTYTTDLDVSGSKNCLQTTVNYGLRRINALEGCEYYFEDRGFAIAQEEIVIITLDDIFLECINTNVDYMVQTQVYNDKKPITRIQKFSTYFIVYCEVGTEFSWIIDAKRIGYENIRLQQKVFEEDYKIESINFSNDLKNIMDIDNYYLDIKTLDNTDIENQLLETDTETENYLMEVI